ncbi:MAG: phosphoribosylanthranilate isomerase [Clostridiales bacterium]|jgi:phosphoribosylanthranilate isomerase|nr:phosphoribosylanthranilate isomerase [Clostridiales bacterium]
MTKLKICGLTRQQDVDIVNGALPDFIGFVFADSRRRVTPEQAAAMKARLDPRIQAVGVFVNAEIEMIADISNAGIVNLVQLHGGEDAAYITELRSKIARPVIKAVRVRSAAQVLRADALPCDYLLLDAFRKDAYGGTGTAFDYALIPKLQKPYFLAGGLNAGNIRRALELQPYCLDVSSGAETDGVKDAEKIREIMFALAGK